MQPLQFFKKMFDYDYWGNREALASLSGITGDATRVCHHLGSLPSTCHTQRCSR